MIKIQKCKTMVRAPRLGARPDHTSRFVLDFARPFAPSLLRRCCVPPQALDVFVVHPLVRRCCCAAWAAAVVAHRPSASLLVCARLRSLLLGSRLWVLGLRVSSVRVFRGFACLLLFFLVPRALARASTSVLARSCAPSYFALSIVSVLCVVASASVSTAVVFIVLLKYSVLEAAVMHCCKRYYLCFKYLLVLILLQCPIDSY